jgi:single-stranded DNA-binding protein
VTGRIESRSYDKDGERGAAVEIVADNIEFLDSKGRNDNPSTPVLTTTPPRWARNRHSGGSR